MKVLPYDIVIQLPAAAKSKAIDLSRAVAKDGGFFALRKRTIVPHISVYFVDLPRKNERKVVKALEKLTKELGHPRCIPLRYRKAGGGYFDILYKKNKGLVKLQKRMIEAINPLRENVIREKYQRSMAKLSRAERNNVKRFGYINIGRNYHPHLTLSRFKEGKEPVPKIKIPKRDLSFRAAEIGFYHRGNHGTCKTLIAKFHIAP